MERGYLTAMVIMASCAFSIWGCAATTARHIAAPTSPPQDVSLQARSEDLEIRLHYVIAPDGPGSWLRGAKWNEFVVSIKNLSPNDVTIERINLIDSRGVYVESKYPSLLELETASENIAKEYALGGQMTALGVASSVAAVFAPIPLPGLTGLLMSGHMYSAQYAGAKDREAIDAEFKKRQLSAPLELSGGALLRGSVFFPLVPDPRAVVLTYSSPKGEAKLRLATEQLLRQAGGAPEKQ